MTHFINRAMPYSVRLFSAILFLLLANVAYAQNTITTVAGGPPPNNVAPTSPAATLEGPQAVVRDASGNLFVVTDSGVIFKVTPGTVAPSIMTIYVGTNTPGFSPNGTPAASTLTFEPFGAALDASGNLYYSDANNCVVREIVGGVVKTVAGTGTCGFSGDTGAATSATLNNPLGIAIDGTGNLYIADSGNNVIRRVDANGIITTYAGNTTAGFSGDGGAATSAELNFPQAVALDTAGDLFIADTDNNVIRSVNFGSKIITTVAGTGVSGYSGDGGPATAATLEVPDGLAVDGTGNIYISDTTNAVIREVFSATSPITPNDITTIAGNNTFGFAGDGGLAINAELTNPAGLFVDPATGDLWFADLWANRIRKYTPLTPGNPQGATITTVVGSGLVGDFQPGVPGGLAINASLYDPRSPALDAQGNLYIVDTQNNRIREVNAAGEITTIVGTGIPCAHATLACGDGGAPTAAALFIPRTVTVEPSGNLLVADSGDQRIREVINGTITTLAGSGAQCGNPTPLPCGDGGPATSASLNDPRAAVVDSHGNTFFVDAEDNRVRKVDTSGIITTVAGNGPNGNAPLCVPGSGENIAGDGGPAIDALLDCPLGLDIDANDNLFISDTQNQRIRRIDAATQIITTVAGSGTTGGFSGDNGPATSATLRSPNRISINGASNFFISDTNNERIRRVDGKSGIITTFAGSGNFGFGGDNGPALLASFSTPTGVVVDNQGNMYIGDLFNNRIRKVLLNPNVGLSVTTLPFANQPLNGNSTLPVTVTNTGDAPLTISNISISAGAFTLAANPCPATLAVGAQCILEIQFAPTQFISYTGTVTISDNGPTPESTQTVNLSGAGAASLTVTATGTGTVTSTPAGITCPGTCTANFTGNSQVVLTAAPGANFTFGGFSTNCVPTNALTCAVTMSANETVTATFVPSGGGGGTIVITPTTLPNGKIGTTYAQVVGAAGAIAPVHFSISAGALPPGLKLSSSPVTGTFGLLAGVPTGPVGTYSFTVQVTDSATPQNSGTANLTLTIGPGADTSNDAELNGSYAFLFQGFNDNDKTMEVVAASFVADGQGNISAGFEDIDSSAGPQPTQAITGTYTLGADNRGTIILHTPSGTNVPFAFSVGNLQSGIATKARLIRFDDVDGTTGHTGSGFLLKQDPSTFGLGALQGSYAFTESGSLLVNSHPQSAVGLANFDGKGNFLTGSIVDTNNAGTLVSAAPISGSYALSNQTVSNGRLTAAPVIPEAGGTFSDVFYIVNSTQFIFISTNVGATETIVYGGMAQLQVPPAGGFGPSSLNGNSVLALQGIPPGGVATALVGSLTATNPNFTLSFVQQGDGDDPAVTGTAGGTYTVTPNGRAVLTFTSGGFAPTIIYLDAVNQGFAAETDTGSSVGPLAPQASNLSNATLSGAGNYFFGSYNPPNIQGPNIVGVASFTGTSLLATSDASGPPGLLDAAVQPDQPNPYTVAANGQLSSTSGIAGYVASACEIEVIDSDAEGSALASLECQGASQASDTLTVAVTGAGTVTSAPAGINCPTACSASFAAASQVVLTATPAAGSTFTAFSDNCVPANPQTNPATCTVTMSAAETVTATFAAANNFTLTVTKAGTGTGTVTSAPAGINCGATCVGSFASSTQVTLTAAPAAGSTFTGWSAPCQGTGTCVVTITAATTVTATFALSANNFTLTITKNGTGTGTVTSTPAGINCGATCSGSFASGTQITLTATPATGSTFAGWSGNNSCEGTGTCTVTITAATTVVATFTQSANNFTLTVTKAGTGTGTVTSTPAGINCGATCSGSFASGTQITLTATPATGSTFAGWGAGPCEGTGTCTLTLTAATTVVANFTQSTNNFTLTVTEAGTGTGTVTSNPAGISCQPTCSASFASGQVVALTATAAEGSTFAGWNGAGCTGTNACSVTVTAAENVTATFNSNGNSPVTITVAPGSPTTVSTTPGGSAVFGLLLTALPGTSGTVTLGCTSPSANITCQVVPATITLTGTGTNVALVLNTFCTAAAPAYGPFPGGPAGGIGLLLATLALCGAMCAMWKTKSQPRWALSFGMLILMGVGLSACASLPKSPGGQATPPGNYALIVTATAPNGSASSVHLTLNVLP